LVYLKLEFLFALKIACHVEAAVLVLVYKTWISTKNYDWGIVRFLKYLEEKRQMSPVTKLNEIVSIKTAEHHPFFSTKVDTYLKWLPYGSVLILDAFNVDTRHDLKKQLLIGGVSIAMLNAIVQPLKKTTHELRPNLTGDEQSFPSSHTAISFLGAEIVHQELSDRYPAASLIGYGVATSTGVLRILKNKHWLTDVLVGAALGILVGKVIYALAQKVKTKKSTPKMLSAVSNQTSANYQ
jgi:Membrane-associated phospholipid phosphatase